MNFPASLNKYAVLFGEKEVADVYRNQVDLAESRAEHILFWRLSDHDTVGQLLVQGHTPEEIAGVGKIALSWVQELAQDQAQMDKAVRQVVCQKLKTDHTFSLDRAMKEHLPLEQIVRIFQVDETLFRRFAAAKMRLHIAAIKDKLDQPDTDRAVLLDQMAADLYVTRSQLEVALAEAANSNNTKRKR